MRTTVLAYAGMIALWPCLAAAETIYKVPTHGNNYSEYAAITENFDPNGTDPIPGEGLWRHLMEHLVFVRAARLGGCDCRVEIVGTESDLTYARAVEEVAAGRAMSFPAATFNSPQLEQRESILLSDPLVDESEFFVGLYTHESRTDVLELTDIDDIRALRFVVGASWATDVQVLEDRGFQIVKGVEWTSMLKMLEAGRADVIMQPFASNADMSFTDVNVEGRFLPVPNVKLSFPFSRHYIVSAEHPDGPDFLKALNNGLAILRDNGELRRLLIAAGVINPRTEAFEQL